MIDIIVSKSIPTRLNVGTALIEVTVDELTAIAKLRDHFKDIAVMIECGVFDFTDGEAIIRRDHDGTLRQVYVGGIRYKR